MTRPEPKDPWEVVCAAPWTDAKGQTHPGYARLCHRDRMEFCERTAKKHAREFKADHLRDAWAQRCD